MFAGSKGMLLFSDGDMISVWIPVRRTTPQSSRTPRGAVVPMGRRMIPGPRSVIIDGMIQATRVLIIALVLSPVISAQNSKYNVEAFSKCQEAVRRNAVDEAVRTCTEPANQGIPGAQYGLGVLLVNQRDASEFQAGLRWLEKAHEAGNPAAAFALYTIYSQRHTDEAGRRAHDLFQEAACAGYPAAVSVLMKQSSEIRCPEKSDFTGEWLADMKWVKTDLPAEGTITLKIAVASDKTARVFMKSSSGWAEVKPGKFNLSVLDQTAILSALDSGWDFEGKWIESWSIQLLRSSSDSATASFFRTVNNVHIPSPVPWRTFSVLAEGSAHITH